MSGAKTTRNPVDVELAAEEAARDYLLDKVVEARSTLTGPTRDEVLEHLTVALAAAQADVVRVKQKWMTYQS